MKYYEIIGVFLSFSIASNCFALDSSTDLELRSKNIQREIITIDTHVDINIDNFTAHNNLGMELALQVDLPKMIQGGLDAAFFIVYVRQDKLTDDAYKVAYKKAKEKFDAIRRMTFVLNREDIDLALSPEAVSKIFKTGKKIAMIGVENAYPIGEDLTVLDVFYKMGARYISLTHNGHNQFADSNFPKYGDPIEVHGGLSSLGKELVERANQLGMILDISHSSKKSALDIITLSKAPVIASHSSVYSLYPHTRNVDDEILEALRKNNGVIQIAAFRSYLKETPIEKMQALDKLADKFKIPKGNIWNEGDRIFSVLLKKSEDVIEKYFEELKKIDDKYYHASVSDLVDHIDYVVKTIGINHVGISSDFGGGGGVTGWNNASETLNVTKELVRREYKKDDIRKIWGGNLLRVWREVEKFSAQRSKETLIRTEIH